MSKTLQEILHYAEKQAATFGSEGDIDHMVVCLHTSRTSTRVQTMLDGSRLPPASDMWECLHQEEQISCSNSNKRCRSDDGVETETNKRVSDHSMMESNTVEEATAENSPPQPTADTQQEEKSAVKTQSAKPESKAPVVPVKDTTANNSSSNNSNSSINNNTKRPASTDAFKLLMKGAINTAALSKPFVMHFNLILTADKKVHVEILLQKQQGSVNAGGSSSHCCDTGDSAAISGFPQQWAWTADSKLHGFSFLMGGQGTGLGSEDVILRVNTNIAPTSPPSSSTSSSSAAEQRPLPIHPSLLKSMLQKVSTNTSYTLHPLAPPIQTPPPAYPNPTFFCTNHRPCEPALTTRPGD